MGSTWSCSKRCTRPSFVATPILRHGWCCSVARDATSPPEATAWLQLATSALIQLRVPVVTAVQGFAAGGGGLGLVCASDIVVAAESAKFFSGAVRVGMAPDGGSSVTLTQLVGLRQALRILLTNPTLG